MFLFGAHLHHLTILEHRKGQSDDNLVDIAMRMMGTSEGIRIHAAIPPLRWQACKERDDVARIADTERLDG